MKKRLFFAFCLIFCAVFTVFSQEAEGASSELPEELQVYFDLYRGTRTLGEKEEILREVLKADPAGSERFYAAILQSLLASYSSINMWEQNAADFIARITVEKLGEAKYTAAAPDIYKVVATVKNSVVRSAAMIALGQIQAKEYLPQIIQLLLDLNSRSPPQNRQFSEQLAFGALVALEYFQDEAGYLPVFFTARGWYNKQIKNQARQTLSKISAEPWDMLISVIKSVSYSIENKRDVLQFLDESSAPDGKKSEGANVALAQTWLVGVKDNPNRENIKALRKTAIRMLGKYGAEDDSTYGFLERAYNQGDVDEKRSAVDTLVALSNSQAVAVLSRFLQAMNIRLTDNALTNSDRAMTRTVIIALGKTESSEARPVLNAVLIYRWPSAVKDTARTSLQKIP
jgi:HEAT repeat protein